MYEMYETWSECSAAALHQTTSRQLNPTFPIGPGPGKLAKFRTTEPITVELHQDCSSWRHLAATLIEFLGLALLLLSIVQCAVRWIEIPRGVDLLCGIVALGVCRAVADRVRPPLTMWNPVIQTRKHLIQVSCTIHSAVPSPALYHPQRSALNCRSWWDRRAGPSCLSIRQLVAKG